MFGPQPKHGQFHQAPGPAPRAVISLLRSTHPRSSNRDDLIVVFPRPSLSAFIPSSPSVATGFHPRAIAIDHQRLRRRHRASAPSSSTFCATSQHHCTSNSSLSAFFRDRADLLPVASSEAVDSIIPSVPDRTKKCAASSVSSLPTPTRPASRRPLTCTRASTTSSTEVRMLAASRPAGLVAGYTSARAMAW